MREVDTARLRPLTLADLDDHARIYSDPEVMQYMPRGPMTPAQAQKASQAVLTQFVRHWEERSFGVWAVTDKTTGQLLGQCGLRLWDAIGEVEVLYLLARASWGKGLATEAAQAALTYGFAQIRLDRIVALAKPENMASQRVMEKLGMRYEKNVRVINLDAVYYAISRDAYLARTVAGYN